MFPSAETTQVSGVRVLVDSASPGARFDLPRLDEVLEPLEVTLGASADDAQGVSRLLDEALGLELHLEHHLRTVVIEPVERDDAPVLRAGGGVPRNALVGLLLADLGIPLAFHTADLSGPVNVRVVALTDRFHALHEARELFELRPLVV